MHKIWLILKNPFSLPDQIKTRMWIYFFKKKTNVQVKGKFIVAGIPMIDVIKSASLEIGKNVTFTSRNKGYHLNLHSPVKIYADRDNAKIKIGNNTRIHGTCIHAYKSISIGDNCLIAANCQIMDGNGHDISFPDVANRIHTVGDAKEIIIGDNVWIGAGTFVLPGVTIGKGSVISANSVVVKDIPPMVLAGGNPARIIRDYNKLGSKFEK